MKRLIFIVAALMAFMVNAATDGMLLNSASWNNRGAGGIKVYDAVNRCLLKNDDNGKRNAPAVGSRAENVTEEGLVPVTIKVQPDKNGENQRAFSMDLIRDDGASWGEMFESNVTLNVPKGEYLVEVMFVDGGLSVLFFPDVKVDGPMELTVNRDMATNSLTADPLIPGGARVVLPEAVAEDNVIGENYNTRFVNAEMYVCYKGVNKGTYMTEGEVENSGWRNEMTIHTNINDGNASFFWTFNMLTKDDKYAAFFITAPCDATYPDGIISNDYTKYLKFEPEIAHTPVYDEMGMGNDGQRVMLSVFNSKDELLSGGGSYSPQPFEVYICNELGDAAAPYALSFVSSLDILRGMPVGIIAPGAIGKDGKMFFASTQDGNSYATSLAGSENVYPVNPDFSFPYFQGLEFGNTSACCVTGHQLIDWSDTPFEYIFIANYYGNAGERRNPDVRNATAEVVIDGKVVLPRGSTGAIYDWAEQRSQTEHPKEKVSYVFYDENIIVDGIKGYNICNVTVDEGKEDRDAPTLQRLMLKNRDGNPTVRFASPADGKIALAGGDFVRNQYMRDTGSEGLVSSEYYTYSPATIKVEYAPRGSQEFTALAVEEDASKFFMPGYGAYWEGNLGTVDRQSPDGWFDLRVTLTDASGNSQVQTISPAFHIESLSSVEDAVTDKDVCIRVENNRIIAPSGAEIYDISGRPASPTPGPGIYIVRHAGKSVKIIL